MLRMDVLILHFDLERRDRRCREYVLMEEHVGSGIMETLRPVVEQNESSLSMGNKLEVNTKGHPTPNNMEDNAVLALAPP